MPHDLCCYDAFIHLLRIHTQQCRQAAASAPADLLLRLAPNPWRTKAQFVACTGVCLRSCVRCAGLVVSACANNNVTHFLFSLRCVTPVKFNAVKKEPGVEHDPKPNQECSASVKTQRKPLLLQQSNAMQLQQRDHLRAALQESEPGADGHEDECHKCRKR